MMWHAMPPELNTALLMAGAGPAPMLQAATGWEALGSALEAQALELAAALVALGAAWTGASSERGIAAATTMVTWLHTAATHAQQCGMKAAAQAASYMKALGTTPSLPEIATNRITTAVLTATNFFGIHTAPIGFKETEYFVGMWNRAGGAMDIYQAETIANTTFPPLEPAKPIIQPGMAEAAEAQAMSSVAMMAAETAPGALGMLSEIDDDIPTPTPTPAPIGVDDVMQFLGGLGQMSGPMQQLMQPLQQLTSLAGQAGNMGGTGGMGGSLVGDKLGGPGDKKLDQMGLLGASPLSNHPLAGGLGPSVGMGLMHAESLPGAGGSAARTALMSSLIDKPAQGVAPAAAGAGSSAAGGAAPMGMMGPGAQSGAGSKPGPAAPVLLAQDDNAHEDFDDVDDRDDW
jgi:PPE-repeat protein